MSATSPTRRDVLATSAAAGALGLIVEQMPAAAQGNNAIRPFKINVSEDALANLRRRIAATQWPEKETVDDNPRACSSRPFRSSRGIGRRTTIGASAKRG